MSIQTALSVGEPVKNLDTSELKEWVALNPMMMSTIPPMSSAREMSLFMFVFLFSLGILPPDALSHPMARNH